MKKIYSLFVALMLMAVGAVMPAKAQSVMEVIDDIHYELFDGVFEASVIALPGGDKYENDVEIPEKVNYLGDDYTVTTIGNGAFAGCSDLTSVTIPTVFRIEDEAFQGCSSLTSIAVPSSVISMGTSVFAQCTALESVTFEANIAIIPEYTFKDCNALESFVVPNDVMEIRTEAFYGCGLEAISLPGSLYLIGESAFENSGLESVELPSNLITIEKRAFAGAPLERVTIPASVNTIGQGAFQDCDPLEEIIVEEANTNYCSKEGMLLSKDEKVLYCVPTNRGLNSTLVIPEGVATIGFGAVKSCTVIKELCLPSSLKTIEDYAFAGCLQVERIVCFAADPPAITGDYAFLSVTNAELLVPAGRVTNYTSDPKWSWCKEIMEETEQMIDGINYRLYITTMNTAEVIALPDAGKYVGDIKLPEYAKYCGADFRVRTIKAEAFKECTDLLSVSLPWTVNDIGTEAFAGCTKLTSINLEVISELGEGAFEGCTALKGVEIPYGISVLRARTFKNCTGLQGVVLSAYMTAVDMEAFAGCTDLKMITCRATSVLPLGTDAFKDVNGDIPVYLPYATAADYNADPTWSSYFHLFIDDSFEQIMDGINYRFSMGDNRLSVVPLPGTDKYEGDIVIPKTVNWFGLDYAVTALSSGAFKDCVNMTSLSLPEGLINIYDEAFRNCGLTEIVIPSSASFIDGSQFYGCDNLRSVTLPSTIAFITDNMFTHCAYLDSVVLPYDIIYIGDEAFYGCTGMTYMYCLSATPPKWGTDNCFKDVPSDILLRVPDGSLGDYSSAPNPGWGYFTNYIGTEVTTLVNGINYTVNLDSYTALVKPLPGIDKYEGTVVVPEKVSFRGKDYTVNGIGATAFMDCADLDTIVLPATIEYIDDEAFNGCSGIELFLCLAPVPPTAGLGAFTGIPSAADLVTPTWNDYFSNPVWVNGFDNFLSSYYVVIDGINYELNVPEKSASVWNHFDGITYYTGDVVVPAKVESFGIPFNVTEIKDNAFYLYIGGGGDENLTSVTLPEGITSIGEYAFGYCRKMTSFTIPSTVTTIGEGAFEGAGISAVTIPAAVASIESSAFAYCQNLTAINVEEANVNYCSVDGVLFSKDKKTLEAFPFKKGNDEEYYAYTVPEGTEAINKRAFFHTNLWHLILPATLTSVGDYAFQEARVDTLTCKAVVPPTATADAFFGTTMTGPTHPLFVPYGSVGAYRTALGWEDFSTILCRELFVEKIEVSNVHGTSADISWKGAGDSYELRYQLYGAGDAWTVVKDITDTKYHLTGLEDNYYYELEVRSKYSGEFGEWYAAKEFLTPELFTLTYKVDGEVYATEEHEGGETIVVLPNPPDKEGYTFSGWQYVREDMPYFDYEISGSYIINKFVVTFYDIYDNILSEQDVKWNQAAEAPLYDEMVVEGYDFLGWEVDFSHVTQNMDVYPLYKKTDYKLTVSTENGEVYIEYDPDYLAALAPARRSPEGKVSWDTKYIDDLEHFNMGQELRFTATPDEGYEFVQWNTNGYNSNLMGVEANPVTFIFPAGDVKLEAVFQLKTYEVTLEAEHGTIDVLPYYLDLTEIEHGTILTLTATADEAYKFIGWSDGVETITRDLTVVSDTIVEALFELIPDFYDPKNLKVTQTPKGNDVEFMFSWNDVEQAVSYQLRVGYDDEFYGPLPTLGYNWLRVNLSAVRESVAVPVAPGSYTIQWAVRSVDIMNNPLCDWVEAEFTLVIEDTGTGVENTAAGIQKPEKVLRDGQLFILIGDKTYDAAGRLVK